MPSLRHRPSGKRQTPPAERSRDAVHAHRAAAVALTACLLSMPCIGHATDSSAGTEATPSLAADSEISALLAGIEKQVLAGQVTTPPHHNAVETWTNFVVKTSGRVSPKTVQQLNDFVTLVRDRAKAEQAAGHSSVSADLLIFADLASDQLRQMAAQQALLPPPAAQSRTTLGEEAASVPAPVPPAPMPPAGAPETPATAAPAVSAPPPSSIAGVPAALPVAAAARSELPVQPGKTQLPDHQAVVNAESALPPRVRPAPAAARNAVPQAPPAPVTSDPAAAALYIKRGDAMLAIKDISAARKFYELAAGAGEARAATAMAETYDAAFLAKLGVVGIQANRALAVRWYREAVALGDKRGAPRLDVLEQNAAR